MMNGATTGLTVEGSAPLQQSTGRRRSLLDAVPLPAFVRRRLAQFDNTTDGSVGVDPSDEGDAEGSGEVKMLTADDAENGTACPNADNTTGDPVFSPFAAPLTALPNAVDDAYACPRDALCAPTLSVLANDNSTNSGAVLNATLDTPPPNGTLSFGANGTFTYSPPL